MLRSCYILLTSRVTAVKKSLIKHKAIWDPSVYRAEIATEWCFERLARESWIISRIAVAIIEDSMVWHELLKLPSRLCSTLAALSLSLATLADWDDSDTGNCNGWVINVRHCGNETDNGGLIQAPHHSHATSEAEWDANSDSEGSWPVPPAPDTGFGLHRR